jgi:hypothetical protein
MHQTRAAHALQPLRAQVPRAARGFQLQMQEDKKEGGFEVRVKLKALAGSNSYQYELRPCSDESILQISPWLRFDTRGGALVWTVRNVFHEVSYGRTEARTRERAVKCFMQAQLR